MASRVSEPHHIDRIADTRDARWPGPVIAWTIRTLALVALAGASYLAITAWQYRESIAGCGGWAFVDCQHVLTSRWARWLGIPVSYPAVVVYALMALSSFFVGPGQSLASRRLARLVLVLTGAMAAGSALWFLAVLVFAIGKVCVFCVLVHTCGLTIGLLLVVHPPVHRWRYTPEWLAALRVCMGFASGTAPKPPEQALTPSIALGAAAVGLLAVGVLIAGQVLFPSKTYRVDQYRSLAIRRSETLSQSSHLLNLSPPPVAKPAEPVEPADPVDVEKPSPPTSQPATDPGPAVTPAVTINSVPKPEPAPETELPKLESRPKTPRSIPILDDEVLLEIESHPLLGDPQAEHVVVELFDYTCKHCRAQSRQMKEAERRYGPQLAVVLLPCPMSPLCNKHIQNAQQEHQNACRYAKTALAVWKRVPSRFAEFHHWLMEGPEPPPLAAVMERATRLVGDESWKEEADGSAIREEIDHNTDLFRRCGAGTIPKLLSGKYVVTGETATARQLFDLLERITGVKPVGR